MKINLIKEEMWKISPIHQELQNLISFSDQTIASFNSLKEQVLESKTYPEEMLQIIEQDKRFIIEFTEKLKLDIKLSIGLHEN